MWRHSSCERVKSILPTASNDIMCITQPQPSRPVLTHSYLKHTHGLTTFNITHKFHYNSRNIWRGIVKPNTNNNSQWNILHNFAFSSGYFHLHQITKSSRILTFRKLTNSSVIWEIFEEGLLNSTPTTSLSETTLIILPFHWDISTCVR